MFWRQCPEKLKEFLTSAVSGVLVCFGPWWVNFESSETLGVQNPPSEPIKWEPWNCHHPCQWHMSSTHFRRHWSTTTWPSSAIHVLHRRWITWARAPKIKEPGFLLVALCPRWGVAYTTSGRLTEALEKVIKVFRCLQQLSEYYNLV